MALTSDKTPPPDDGSGRPKPHIPDYDVIRPIGRGSFGEVWLARSVVGTWRAVKVVDRRNFENDRPYEREFEGIKRFEPVSRTHDSQVDILHIGRNDAEGYFYYVMELADDAGGTVISNQSSVTSNESFADGRALTASLNTDSLMTAYSPRTLKADLQRHAHLSAAQCVEIGLSLATALGHLHKHGLLHRDVKPSNIIFIGGIPKLADIGLVTGTEATVSIVGTEGYIPPHGGGTARADLYALGKVLYEASTGKDRHDFPDPPTLLAQRPDLDDFLELDEVIQKACASNPDKGYASAEELHADLLLLKTGKSVKRLRLMERRVTRATRVGIAAVLLALLVTVALVLVEKSAERSRQQFAHSERLRLRAEGAEREAQKRLAESYLAQARANRWSGRAGRRFDSLKVLAQAAELNRALGLPEKNILELRNEAIACMILPDLGLAREWKGYPEGSDQMEMDDSMLRYARSDIEGNVSVRRIADDQELFHAPTPGEQNWALRLSPNGRFLAAKNHHVSNRRPNFFQVWDVDEKKRILSVTNIARNFVFDLSPDSRTVAVALWGGPFVTYELSTGQERRRTGTNAEPNWMRFRPDGAQIALADSRRPRVDIHETGNGNLVATLPHPQPVWSLDWHPTGKFLAAGCTDRHVYLWDLIRTQRVAVLKGHTSVPVYTRFSHGGDLLASRCWDNTVRLWEPFSGRQLVSMFNSAGVLRFSPDDSQLGLIGAGPQKLGILQVAAGRECRTLRGHTTRRLWSASFSADGRLLATRSDDGVRLWDLAVHREVVLLSVGGGALKLHPDGQSLFTSGGQAGLHRWPIQVAKAQDGLRVEIGSREALSDLRLEGITLSPDGQKLASGLFGDGVRIFNLRDLKTKPLLLKHDNAVNASFSPDGKWIVTSVWQGRGAKIWDARTGELARELTDEDETHAQFSPDGRWLVTANRKEYRFWDATSWQPLHRVPTENGDGGNMMVFPPDGKIVAINHRTHGVRLLECETGRELAILAETDQSPYCFSPDGNVLVTGDVSSEIVRLWDLRLIRSQLSALKLDW